MKEYLPFLPIYILPHYQLEDVWSYQTAKSFASPLSTLLSRQDFWPTFHEHFSIDILTSWGSMFLLKIIYTIIKIFVSQQVLKFFVVVFKVHT